MVDTLIRVVARDDASAALKKVQGNLSNLAKAAGSSGQAFNVLGTAMSLGVGAGALYMARNIAEATVQLGAQTMQMRDRLGELATSAGGSADAMVAAMKRASAGTVAESDIILAANRGIMLGLGANADQWEELSEVARYRAQAMGVSMTQALGDISLGIGRESRLILDNLGIILDLDKVMDDYAKTLGKTADQLTAVERKQGIMTAVITEGQKQIADAGGISETAAERMQMLMAAVQDLKAAFGEAVAGSEAFNQMLKDLVSLLRGGGMDMFVKDTQKASWGKFGILDKKVLDLLETIGYFKEELSDTGPANEWGMSLTDLIQRTKLLDDTTKKLRGPVVGMNVGRNAQYSQWQALNDRIKTEGIAAAKETAEEEKKAAKESLAAWEETQRKREQAYEDLKSTIESALQPSTVTAADMAASKAGTYQEKWDEDARQLDAIAERGFAELKAHPDWAGMLGIPAEVLSGTEAQLMAWAQRTSGSIRNLENPEWVAANMDALIAQVQGEIQRKAAHALSIDMIAQEMLKRGLVGDIGAAKQQLEAMADPGMAAAKEMQAGFEQHMAENPTPSLFIAQMDKDIATYKSDLSKAGGRLWRAVEPGIQEALKSTPWVREFARHMAPYVADVLIGRGVIQG